MPFCRFFDTIFWVKDYFSSVELSCTIRCFFFSASQVRKVKRTDVTFGELTPYNIVPLDAPSLANAIGFFPEVSLIEIMLVS